MALFILRAIDKPRKRHAQHSNHRRERLISPRRHRHRRVQPRFAPHPFCPQRPAPYGRPARHHRRRTQPRRPASGDAGAGRRLYQSRRRPRHDGCEYRRRDESGRRAPRHCRRFHRHLRRAAARSAAPLPRSRRPRRAIGAGLHHSAPELVHRCRRNRLPAHAERAA